MVIEDMRAADKVQSCDFLTVEYVMWSTCLSGLLDQSVDCTGFLVRVHVTHQCCKQQAAQRLSPCGSYRLLTARVLVLEQWVLVASSSYSSASCVFRVNQESLSDCCGLAQEGCLPHHVCITHLEHTYCKLTDTVSHVFRNVTHPQCINKAYFVCHRSSLLHSRPCQC